MPDDGPSTVEGWGMVSSDPATVLVECYVQNPMDTVFYSPVGADGLQGLSGAALETRDAVAGLH